MFWKYLLGNILIKIQNLKFNPRGKQRFLILIDRILGSHLALTEDGLILRIFPSSPMDAYYFRSDETSQLLKDLIATLSSDSIFIDIGANIGYFSLLASRQMQNNGLVIAFEPSNREIRRLLENVDINNSTNIVVMSTGLGYKGGINSLSISNHTGLNRFSDISKNHEIHKQKHYPCAVLKFDDLSYLIPDTKEIDLVKIDVEGAELQVLKGMANLLKTKRIKKLFVEITPTFLNDFGDNREELFQYLAMYGYKPKFNKYCFQYDELFLVTD
jgi:FkbM family methyltransferase